MEELWKYYKVSLHILDRIFGGLPKNPELIEGFLKGKGVSEEIAKEIAPRIAEEVGAEVEAEEKMWTTFKRDEHGIYIETRQIKAMLKEAVGETEMWKVKGLTGLKSRVGGAVFPKGEGGTDMTRIYFYRVGNNGPEKVKEPDGFEETVGHISGPQGKRSILKRKDYVEEVQIHFDLKVGNKRITDKVLLSLFEFGQELGLGADRSMEHGKFQVLKFEPMTDEEISTLYH